MTHDQIIVTLPNELRLGPIRYIRNREVGFLFTNRAKHLFSLDMGLESSDQLNAWVEKHGMPELIHSMLYYSAIAYCNVNKQKVKFTKESIIRSFELSDKETQIKVMNVWQKSQTFGATVKKKVTRAKVKR